MEVKNYLENIYNLENFEDYAFQCCSIALEILKKQNEIDSIILPSRGAIPIFFGILSYVENMKDKDKSSEEFFNNLSLCPFINEYYRDLKQDEFKNKEGKINVLILPYTADINLKNKADTEKFIDLTREYWVNVTSVFYKNKKERLNDDNFLLYLFLLSELEGRKDLVNYYKNFPKIKNPLMIDTVISGRAISTIIKNFEGLVKKGVIETEPYVIIMIDKEGRKLKSPYKEYLNNYAFKDLEKGRVNITFDYKVKELFTEDKGSGLEGLISIIYPDLMIHSTKIKNIKTNFFGAGTWIMPNKKYQKTFLRFLKCLDYSVKSLAVDGKLTEKLIKEIELLRIDLKDIFNKNNREELTYVQEFLEKVQSKKNENERYFFGNGYETRSHVVHIPLLEQSIYKFFEDYLMRKGKLKYD